MAQLYHLETNTIITMEKSPIIYNTTENPKSSKKYKTIPFGFCIIHNVKSYLTKTLILLIKIMALYKCAMELLNLEHVILNRLYHNMSLLDLEVYPEFKQSLSRLLKKSKIASKKKGTDKLLNYPYEFEITPLGKIQLLSIL